MIGITRLGKEIGINAPKPYTATNGFTLHVGGWLGLAKLWSVLLLLKIDPKGLIGPGSSLCGIVARHPSHHAAVSVKM
jgi:hypothetical protein